MDRHECPNPPVVRTHGRAMVSEGWTGAIHSRRGHIPHLTSDGEHVFLLAGATDADTRKHAATRRERKAVPVAATVRAGWPSRCSLLDHDQDGSRTSG